MFKMIRRTMLSAVLVSTAFLAMTVNADHPWSTYHWARTSNPFTLKLGDNVTSTWDSYLTTASTDWTASSVLDTTIVAGGTTGRRCRATTGRVEVCNSTYGNTGWLGVAQIWLTNGHISQGIVKLNDTYHDSAPYNTVPWRRLVMCQEIGHTFGLGHQDEVQTNPNLGSCMDYTNDPDGPPSNEHPNAHDYDQLATIYAHLDSTTTVGQSIGQSAHPAANLDLEEPSQWGRLVNGTMGRGKSVHMREFGNGHRVYTFVTWLPDRR